MVYLHGIYTIYDIVYDIVYDTRLFEKFQENFN